MLIQAKIARLVADLSLELVTFEEVAKEFPVVASE